MIVALTFPETGWIEGKLATDTLPPAAKLNVGVAAKAGRVPLIVTPPVMLNGLLGVANGLPELSVGELS